jgi:hypothetical protein
VLLTADGGGEEALGGLERLELGVEMIEAQYAEDSPAFAGRMLIELGDQFRGERRRTRRRDSRARLCIG